MFRRFRYPALLLAALLISAPLARAAGYDPLAVPANFTPETLLLDVEDPSRHRDIPIKLYLPAAKSPAPIVLFSHGLGGSRDNDGFLGQHWAARGYVAVFMQHPGSDDSVWKGKQPNEIMAAMRKAASAQNLMLRVKDVSAVLDQLAKWNGDAKSPLAGRLDLSKVGMSGHSFGALTTQYTSGESFGNFGNRATDSRIKAACMFSPSSPKRGSAQAAFGTVQIPWLLMTGTKDKSPIGDQDVASRLAVFPELPAGGKYQVVLDGAEHSAFGDRALPGDAETRNPNHHRVMLAITTAFWDAYLKGDAAAKAWLDGTGPGTVLEKADKWEKK